MKYLVSLCVAIALTGCSESGEGSAQASASNASKIDTTEQNQTVPQETASIGYPMFSARDPGKPAQGR